MKKFEYFEYGEFLTTYRIVPAFMSDGVRVFRKKEYEKDEIWAFNERVFESEEQAEAEIARRLNLHIKLGKIDSYTVKEDKR